jgi:hypothetical protein
MFMFQFKFENQFSQVLSILTCALSFPGEVRIASYGHSLGGSVGLAMIYAGELVG